MFRTGFAPVVKARKLSILRKLTRRCKCERSIKIEYCLHILETGGKLVLSLDQIVFHSKCEQTLGVNHVCSWSKCCKFWETMLGKANVVKILVLNKFAWGSKCDQTLAVEHVCSDSK